MVEAFDGRQSGVGKMEGTIFGSRVVNDVTFPDGRVLSRGLDGKGKREKRQEGRCEEEKREGRGREEQEERKGEEKRGGYRFYEVEGRINHFHQNIGDFFGNCFPILMQKIKVFRLGNVSVQCPNLNEEGSRRRTTRGRKGVKKVGGSKFSRREGRREGREKREGRKWREEANCRGGEEKREETHTIKGDQNRQALYSGHYLHQTTPYHPHSNGTPKPGTELQLRNLRKVK
jgi:hypothetical protein